MGRFVKGDIVILPFPFSNLSGSKKRPAFVIQDLEGDDLIVCQITSKFHYDSHSIYLANSDFANGSLPQNSFIRPNKIFTAEDRIIIGKAGNVKINKIDEVINELVDIITH